MVPRNSASVRRKEGSKEPRSAALCVQEARLRGPRLFSNSFSTHLVNRGEEEGSERETSEHHKRLRHQRDGAQARDGVLTRDAVPY
jgi:hypothetical protein